VNEMFAAGGCQDISCRRSTLCRHAGRKQCRTKPEGGKPRN
jgi:hypothetical protein